MVIRDPGSGTGHDEIRLAGPGDAEAIARVLSAAFLEHEPSYTPAAYAHTVLDPAHVLLRLEEGPVWIVTCHGTAAGTVSARSGSGGGVYLRSLAVDPGFRGRGVGRQLLAEAIDFARGAGHSHVELDCTPFLRDAMRLYASLGFRVVSESEKLHGTPLIRLALDLL